MLGAVQSRELLAALLDDQPLDLRRWVRRAPIIPDTVDALDVLNTCWPRVWANRRLGMAYGYQ